MNTRKKHRFIREENTYPVFDIKPDMKKLQAYKQIKLEQAAPLRIVREAMNTLGKENAEQQCGELMVKLAEDRFSLAVQHFKEDAEDMRSYAMKSEALRRALHNRNVEEAYKRTIIRIVGDKRVSLSWK